MAMTDLTPEQLAEIQRWAEAYPPAAVGPCHYVRMLLAEVERLREELEQTKRQRDLMTADVALRERERDQVREALAEYESVFRERGDHLLSEHCWCQPVVDHVSSAPATEEDAE
jgi:hypothetical protein